MCSICLEENDQKYIHTKGYTFIEEEECYSIECNCNICLHEECLISWIKKTKKCPICVEPLINKKIRDKIRDDLRNELKELYLFEILIILILIQIHCFLFQLNPYKMFVSLFIVSILAMVLVHLL